MEILGGAADDKKSCCKTKETNRKGHHRNHFLISAAPGTQPSGGLASKRKGAWKSSDCMRWCRLLDMAVRASLYAAELRRELRERNRLWARGRAHVESYGAPPVIVYAPEHSTVEGPLMGLPLRDGRHGNFFDNAYAAITTRPDWMRRFDKIHAQGKALPKAESGRRWRELDSSMSSDALLMNVFCVAGVVEAPAVQRPLGVDAIAEPVFG